MVKGISRQVIVVHSPDKKLFEQAIFILKDGAVNQGVTEELLLKEARQAVSGNTKRPVCGPLWAVCGALLTGAAWLLTTLL